MNSQIDEAELKISRINAGAVPVDLEKIAKALNASIVQEELEDNVSGMLLVSKKTHKSVIVLNFKHSETRKRFTAAHEIAHLLLHRDQDTFIDSIGTATMYFRSDKSSESLREMEREANNLAAKILMPKNEVKQELRNKPVDINDDTAIKRLAAKFNVSIQALVIRLTTLGLFDKETI